MEKLIVYKNDSPQSISNEFCQKYNLSTEKRDILISVIKNQVCYYLFIFEFFACLKTKPSSKGFFSNF